MVCLNRLNENTVCPNVFTTGMPRTYSTASFDMRSSAFWYSVMVWRSVGPIMNAKRMAKASATVAMQSSPMCQSNQNSSTSMPAGVA